MHQTFFFDAESHEEPSLDEVIETFISYNNVTTKTNEPEHELMKPLLNWLPLDVIKNTFQLSTQHACNPESTFMKNNYRSYFPSLNIKRRNKPVATDAFY